MKKKVLFVLLLFGCFFVNVYATSIKDESGVVIVGNVEVPVYNVEVIWGKMDFTYTEQINYVWNDDTHIYEVGKSTYNWISKDNYVDVNNKSNISIDVELEYVNLNKNVNGNFDVSKKKLKSDASNRFTLTLNGNLSGINTDSVKVGTINVRFS